MKKNYLKQGVIFGIAVTIFNLIYQYMMHDESGWTWLLASTIGGLIGGSLFAQINKWSDKRKNRNK